MTFRLVVRFDAEQDLAEARDWYESQREGLGSEFLLAVDEALDHIRKKPQLFALHYKTIRRVGLTRFPFVVYYRIVGEAVEVIAVMHGSRSPRQWRSRS